MHKSGNTQNRNKPHFLQQDLCGHDSFRINSKDLANHPNGSQFTSSATNRNSCGEYPAIHEKFGENGRGSKIRTCDPLVPNQMRYQAALYPDVLISAVYPRS
jgi:hypothetical protein